MKPSITNVGDNSLSSQVTQTLPNTQVGYCALLRVRHCALLAFIYTLTGVIQISENQK